jgi:hypothetical protein
VTRLRVYGTERAFIKDVDGRLVADEVVFMEELRRRGAMVGCEVGCELCAGRVRIKTILGPIKRTVSRA